MPIAAVLPSPGLGRPVSAVGLLRIRSPSRAQKRVEQLPDRFGAVDATPNKGGRQGSLPGTAYLDRLPFYSLNFNVMTQVIYCVTV